MEEVYLDRMRYLIAAEESQVVHPLLLAGTGFSRTPAMEKAGLLSQVADWASPKLAVCSQLLLIENILRQDGRLKNRSRTTLAS
jgi:hypothetical protein